MNDSNIRTEITDEQRQFDESERARQEKADLEISEAGDFDNSDERLRGDLAFHGAGGYASLGPSSSGLVGGQITVRHAFFATAPSSGLAWGLELRGTALGLAATWFTVIGGVAVAVTFSWAEILRGLGLALRFVLGMSLLFEFVVAAGTALP